jgi:hypothetical protein
LHIEFENNELENLYTNGISVSLLPQEVLKEFFMVIFVLRSLSDPFEQTIKNIKSIEFQLIDKELYQIQLTKDWYFKLKVRNNSQERYFSIKNIEKKKFEKEKNKK